MASQSSTAAPLTDSRLAALCARTVQESFTAYESRFHEITCRARDRFLARDWAGSSSDAANRLRLYTEVLDDLTAKTKELLGQRLCERPVWTAIKAVYSSLIINSVGWEIAESFFNSLTRRVFATEGLIRRLNLWIPISICLQNRTPPCAKPTTGVPLPGC